MAEGKLAPDESILHFFKEEGDERSDVWSKNAHEQGQGQGGSGMGMGRRTRTDRGGRVNGITVMVHCLRHGNVHSYGSGMETKWLYFDDVRQHYEAMHMI